MTRPPAPPATPVEKRERGTAADPKDIESEDESADPVGDGHSDADLAERLPPAEKKPQG